MNSPQDKSPWNKSGKQAGSKRSGGIPVGVVVWFVLFLALGGGIWFLADMFPGSLQSEGNRMELVHAVALLALISSGLLFARWVKLGESLRNIAIWMIVVALLLVGYSFQEELVSIAKRVQVELLPGQPVVGNTGEVTLIKGGDGHFHVTGLANGVRVSFLIDTGATGIVLTPDDVRRMGIDPAALEYTRAFETANGRGYGAPLRLRELVVGPFGFRDIGVTVNQAAMNQSLLGMSFLDRLQSFEIKGRKLILR